MKLNLNGWKKVSSHKDHSILKNKDGHELKVVHKALSKDAKGQLEKLEFAEGGQVDKGPKIDPKKAKEIQDSAMQSGWQPQKWVQNAKEGLGIAKAHGGKVQMFANKGIVEAEDPNADLSEDTETADASETPEGVPLPEGGMSPQEVAQDNAESTGPEAIVGFNPNSPSGKELAAKEAVMQANPTAEQAPAGAQPMDPNSPVGPQQPNLLQQYGDSLKKEGELRDKQGQEQANAANAHIKALDKIHSDSKGILEPMQNEILTIAHDQSEDKIDTDAYWKDHSRAFAAIGLALSSIGGQGEAAMNFLNKAIERNVDAQKAIIKNKNDKRQTLLGALQKQYGDGLVAENMAKASEAATYLAKAQAIAAKSNSPIQQEAVKRMYLDFASKYQAGVEQAAVVHAADKALQQGGDNNIEAALKVLDKADPKRSEKERARWIPGTGQLAKVDVPQSIKDNLLAKMTLDERARDFYDWASKHSGSLDPKDIATGHTKAAELQSMYRNSINGGVFKKGEQEFIDNIVDSDPTKFFNSIRVLPKLKEVVDSNDAQLAQLKKSIGLTHQGQPPTAETRELGGSTYQKVGPNKWQKIK